MMTRDGGEIIPEDGEPEVSLCMDEFGPLNLTPSRTAVGRAGRQAQGPRPRTTRRRRATYNRYGEVRHLFAALDLAKDRLDGHTKPIKKRIQFREFCRYLRTLYPPTVRIEASSPPCATSPSTARTMPTTRNSAA